MGERDYKRISGRPFAVPGQGVAAIIAIVASV
jgi:hypothetical protein